MLDRPISPPTWRMCAGFICAPVAAALALGAMFPLTGTSVPFPRSMFWTAQLYVVVAGLMTLAIGLPVYAWLRWRVRLGLLNCILAGGVIAGPPWLLLFILFSIGTRHGIEQGGETVWVPELSMAHAWLELLLISGMIAGAGAIGGAVFWLVAIAGAKQIS